MATDVASLSLSSRTTTFVSPPVEIYGNPSIHLRRLDPAAVVNGCADATGCSISDPDDFNRQWREDLRSSFVACGPRPS